LRLIGAGEAAMQGYRPWSACFSADNWGYSARVLVRGGAIRASPRHGNGQRKKQALYLPCCLFFRQEGARLLSRHPIFCRFPQLA
jgi:hypothetical protein